MKATLKNIVFALAASSLLVGCLDDKDGSTNIMQTTVTIDGNLNDGYTFYVDNGGIIKPTTESVLNVSDKGFTSERAIVYVSYSSSNIKKVDGGEILDGATFITGQYMQTAEFLTKKELEEKKINSQDSIFNIRQLYSIWCYRGYLSTIMYAPYSIISNAMVPSTLNIGYDPDSIAENKLDLTLYYNRHTVKDADSSNTYDFYYSFPLYKLAELIPGNDSIDITICAAGVDTVALKVSRENMLRSNYLPFQEK